MNSRTTPRFWNAFEGLADDVKQQAGDAYRIFQNDPSHPGLRFKKVHPELPVYSARINRDHRAVGVLNGDTIVWFWIGNHEGYERLLQSL